MNICAMVWWFFFVQCLKIIMLALSFR